MGAASGPKHDYRPARAQEIQVIATDGGTHALTAARIAYKQQTASGTDAGRAAYKTAWNTILAVAPALAQQAIAAGGLDDPPATDSSFPAQGTYSPSSADARTALAKELDRTLGNVRSDIGEGAQRILSGAGASVNNRLNPGAGAVSIPTNITQLVMFGLILALGIFLVLKASRR